MTNFSVQYVTSHLIVFHTIKQNIKSWSDVVDSGVNIYIYTVHESGTVIQKYKKGPNDLPS